MSKKISPITRRVIEDLIVRDAAGQKKFGREYDTYTYPTLAVARELYEELLDAANYTRNHIDQIGDLINLVEELYSSGDLSKSGRDRLLAVFNEK